MYSEEMLQMMSHPPETEFNPLDADARIRCYKTKLEQYLDVLKLLSSQGPVTLQFIVQQTAFNSDLAAENLNILINQNLVEKEANKYGMLYSISNRGEKVVSFFGKASILPSKT